MVELVNPAKARLEAGELAIGIGLRQSRHVEIGKAMKSAGYDWVFIDMEHGAMDVDMATQISVAAQDAGVAPIVRVPGFEHYHATRVLDGGALGIVIPHVDDAETAARMVSNCRYPPDGARSMAGGLPQLNFASHPIADTARAINDATLVVVMIETETAVANADAIAAVPGVDALLIGTNDLCLDMGIPGQYDHSRVHDAYTNVITACQAHGKHAGMGGVYDPTLMATYIGMGMRLIIAGSDFGLMMAAARTQAAAVRGAL